MTDKEFLRHTLATLAYRAAKAMRDAPDTFAGFRAEKIGNSPLRIISHMGDLFAWALTLAQGEPKWNDSPPAGWEKECERFFSALKEFDAYLASDAPVHTDLTRLFQGPVADALTHTGQLTMLRRLHGSPVKGESYNHADIAVGRIGFDQRPPNPKYEFD